ncbi:MAG: tryptophan--tRNA ligase [Oscillospiraceae bacterium]|jgi:tryptophanyl-tRNA synthetase|nr:tryptophan--tRNA ligase [Oscillospiraceae bacterium]
MGELILTGARPTGALHLGHYVGALRKFAGIQHEGESYFIISDLHFLTSRCAKSEIAKLKDNAIKMMIDSLAIGLSFNNTHFYLQSRIPEAPQIYVLIQNLITVERAYQNPALSAVSAQPADLGLPFGLLGYPILEAADIIGMQADKVVVGKDNVDHLNVTCELVDRLNTGFDTKLKTPVCVTDRYNDVVGLDGRWKMSKSLNNAVYLSDTQSDIDQKLSDCPWHAYCDRNHKNAVIEYIRIFDGDEKRVAEICRRFENGEIAEGEARDLAKDVLNRTLSPIREKIAAYEEDRSLIESKLEEGTLMAREIIRASLSHIKSSMGMPPELA